MIQIPQKVITLINNLKSTKILSSISSDGTPHSIVVGSVMSPDEKTICASELLMQKTASNFKANKNAAILVVKEKESYLINATVNERVKSGSFYGNISNIIKEATGLTPKAVWTFVPNAVYDEGAGANAGTKIA